MKKSLRKLQDEFLTTTQAAELLNVSTRHARNDNLGFNTGNFRQGGRVTKKYALFIGLSLTLLAAGNASGVSKDLPDDFRIVAVAGGVAPSESVSKVEIDSNGQAIYSILDAENRSTGVYKVLARFDIPVSRLGYVYKRIKDNKFMSLKSEYVDKTVTDGSFALLTVTADKKTRTVRTQNISVKAFDTVMIALNLSLPKDRRIIYNEISY